MPKYLIEDTTLLDIAEAIREHTPEYVEMIERGEDPRAAMVIHTMFVKDMATNIRAIGGHLIKNKSLHITENGTYDVTGYSEVYVTVGE